MLSSQGMLCSKNSKQSLRKTGSHIVYVQWYAYSLTLVLKDSVDLEMTNKRVFFIILVAP